MRAKTFPYSHGYYDVNSGGKRAYKGHSGTTGVYAMRHSIAGAG
jgi:hypothetical protein